MSRRTVTVPPSPPLPPPAGSSLVDIPSSSDQPAITEIVTTLSPYSGGNRRTRTASQLSESESEASSGTTVVDRLRLPPSTSRTKRRKRDHQHQSSTLADMHSSNGSGEASTSYSNGSTSSNGVAAGPSSPGKQRSHANGHNGTLSSSSASNGFQPIYPGSQIDREELVRLALQCLQDANYPLAVAALSKESGYTLESPTITTFRNGVLQGKWETVMRLLKDEEIVSGETLKVSSARSHTREW